jgi:hypothetical protein
MGIYASTPSELCCLKAAMSQDNPHCFLHLSVSSEGVATIWAEALSCKVSTLFSFKQNQFESSSLELIVFRRNYVWIFLQGFSSL